MKQKKRRNQAKGWKECVKKGIAKLALAKNGKSLLKNIGTEKSSYTLNRFKGAVRAFGFRDNCGNSSGEKSNVCDGVQIFCGIDTVDPEALLTC